MFINRYGPMGWGVGVWDGSVILARHNFSLILPAEHNKFVSRMTVPERIIPNYSSIIRQTLLSTDAT